MPQPGPFVVRHRAAILLATLAFVALAGVVGGGVIDRLSVGGLTDPATESARADQVMEHELGIREPNLVLLVTDPRGVDSPEVADAATALVRRLAGEPDIGEVTSYWTADRPPSLRGGSAEHALILARVKGRDRDEVQTRVQDLAPRYSAPADGLDVRLGGPAMANLQITEETRRDLIAAESVALPLTLLALVLVFGSVVAASLPVLIGVLATVGMLVALRVVGVFTDVHIFALNVATGLGLGLAIDYSLFIVTRYREELRRGRDVSEAIAVSLRTAGRTVLFSAVTVALALSGLLFFPFYFLRSFAYAGIPTALVAAVASVVVLPALLAALGPRIDRLRLLRREPVTRDEPGFWHRVATRVMRRPVSVLVVAVTFLVVLGLPFLHLRMGLPDERVLPSSTSAFQVGETIRGEFDSREAESVYVVAPAVEPASRAADIAGYAARLSELPNVVRVDAATGSYADGATAGPTDEPSGRFSAGPATYLRVVASVDAASDAGQALVRQVRDVSAPFDTLVTGQAATLVDSIDSLYDHLPIALLVIFATVMILIFLMTGSVVVPIKAAVLNVLSLSATFGVLVWGFQDGHLRGWLGEFTVTGEITWTVPLLLFVIAFGLSMDYEVFLLSRIKEEYDATGDNTRAVAWGLERSGRVVTAAAVLIAIVFLAFTTAGVSYMKAVGLGLALAVVMDATVVRGTLLPAFMRLLGRANWWAPSPLRWVHTRLGFSESGAEPTSAPEDAGRR